MDGLSLIKATHYSLSKLHERLIQRNIQWLWLHAPRETEQKLFGRTFIPTRSYLFQVEENGFKLIRSDHHPNYM